MKVDKKMTKRLSRRASFQLLKPKVGSSSHNSEMVWAMVSRHTLSSYLPSNESILTIRRQETVHLTLDLPDVRVVLEDMWMFTSPHSVILVLHTVFPDERKKPKTTMY
jgi:hypothetical protein